MTPQPQPGKQTIRRGNEGDGTSAHKLPGLRVLDNPTGGKRDIFQAIVWDGIPGSDIELATGTNPEYLIDAVEIAVVRGKMEDAIFRQPILPTQQWLDEYKKLMLLHPRVRPYGHMFNNIFYQAYSDHMDVAKAWKDAHVKVDQNVENGMFEVASPEAATEICKSILGFEPTNQSRARHGAVSINVTLSDDDFAAYAKKRHGHEALDFRAPYYEIGKSAPVFVTSESSMKGYEEAFAISYLLSIYMNYLFLRATSAANLDELLPASTSRNLMELFTSPNRQLAEKIISFTTNLGFIDSKIATKKNVRDLLTQTGDAMIEVNKKHDDELNREDPDLITASMQSLADAYDFFRDYFPDLNAGRIARDTLSQFPITRWKTVVEEIRKRQAQLHPDVQPVTESI